MNDGTSLAEAYGTDAADGWTPDALVELRETPRARWIALLAAAAVGLGAAWLHWLGLFVAGALVGLVSRDLPRALAAGVAVGVLALVAQVLVIPGAGVGEFLALAPASSVAVAAGLLAPVWGSLVRGVL